MKWIEIYIRNPFKTMNKLKGVFKPLKCYFIFGKKIHYKPFIYCPKPSYILIKSCDVGWKDKYDTPRYESPPYIWIHLFKYDFIWYWNLRPHQQSRIDDYWEQALWYLYYYDNISCGRLDSPNIEKAKEYWPWQNMDGTSTWSDKFLIKK